MPEPIARNIVYLFTLFSLLIGMPLLRVQAQPQQQGLQGVSLPMTEEAMARFRENLVREFGEKANQVLDLYIKSQQAFYSRDHARALQHIDQALAIRENADLLAFKGVIFYGMGRMDEARSIFSRAFALDSTLPLPQAEGLAAWLRQNSIIP